MALINLRNALMARKRLPYDAEVEYLQSSGNSASTVKMWINTGIEALATTAIESTFQYTDTGYGYAMGQGQANGNRFSIAGIRSNSRLWSLAYNNWHDFSISADTAIHTFKLDGSTKTGSVDATSISFSDSYTSDGGTIGLFCRNCNGGTTQNWGCNGKLYSCKIWDNGVLVRDYIPVRKGTVGYLYDRVSGKLFGNAGSGDFVLGPDVVPVEYIESHGTEWIDTGVIGYKTTKIKSHCALLNAYMAYPAMWGARTGSRNNDFQICYNTPTTGGNPSSIVLRTGNSDKSVSTSDIRVNTFIGTRLDIVAADGALSVNGYNFSTPAFSNFTTPHSILMFCEYTGNRPANFGSFVYWGMKMWQADSIVRSFLPVRVGTDVTSWEGAMMDVLTRRIYRNAGTGAFTYGNDLKYPIPG